MIVKALRFDAPLLTSRLLLGDDPTPSSVLGVGSAPKFIVARVGPFDLLPGDVVVISGESQYTRPMPGDADAWTWYVNSGTQPPHEGQLAEDHNPAVVMQGVFRTGAPDSLVSEWNVCKYHTENILQYEHHKAWERASVDVVTAARPGRYYSLIAAAACAKPGHPPGSYVRVDYAQMAALQLRDGP